MKTRESSMPDATYWQTFFNSECIVVKLGCDASCRDVVEFGCGYGTFTVPAALAVRGTVYALDIDPAMIAATQQSVQTAGLSNVEIEQRDFLAEGSGRPNASCDYALLFNILHCEEPVALLREAYRTLAPGGRAGIIHWNHDPTTPRGPSLAIRPQPEQCRAWAEEAGFVFERFETLTCCSYHWGLILRRPDSVEAGEAVPCPTEAAGNSP